MSQLLTQEYGGRDSDITILPWRREHTVVSAFGAFMKVCNEEKGGGAVVQQHFDEDELRTVLCWFSYSSSFSPPIYQSILF